MAKQMTDRMVKQTTARKKTASRSSSRQTKRKRQAQQIIETLKQFYGPVECTLNDHDHPWRLLVGAILAAQCTDERVNQVTPALFEAFPDIESIAQSSPETIEPYIRSCGLYRNKAKGIYGSAYQIMHHFDGVVPQTLDELLTLPGVGRKIANLLIGDVFGGQAIVVDTHCGRLARLMGFTTSKDPYRIERDLMAVVPEVEWSNWGHYMVHHGRELCPARAPKCDLCPIQSLCDTGLLVAKHSKSSS